MDPIQLHLRGGVQGASEATVEAIKLWMKERRDLPMEIASEDILDSQKHINGQSLSIDSRNGEVGGYDPFANPKRREKSKAKGMLSALMKGIVPKVYVAYCPQ